MTEDRRREALLRWDIEQAHGQAIVANFVWELSRPLVAVLDWLAPRLDRALARRRWLRRLLGPPL